MLVPGSFIIHTYRDTAECVTSTNHVQPKLGCSKKFGLHALNYPKFGTYLLTLSTPKKVGHCTVTSYFSLFDHLKCNFDFSSRSLF
jgi:hypothetical protein